MNLPPEEHLALLRFFRGLGIHYSHEFVAIGEGHRHQGRAVTIIARIGTTSVLSNATLDLVPMSLAVEGLRINAKMANKYRALAAMAWQLSGYLGVAAENADEAMTDLLSILALWVQGTDRTPNMLKAHLTDFATTGFPFGMATLRKFINHRIEQEAIERYGEVYGAIVSESLNAYGSGIMSLLDDDEEGILGTLLSALSKARGVQKQIDKMDRFFDLALAYYQGKQRYTDQGGFVPA